MVTMQGLWLAKHENGCNSKTKSRIGLIIGGLVDENIPEGLMEPIFIRLPWQPVASQSGDFAS